MRALVQRVDHAKVSVGGQVSGEIGCGLCVFLGVFPDDGDKDIEWLVEKIVNLRIFDDENGKMNVSLLDKNGSLLIVSQFTLCGDCRHGRRPSWVRAAEPVFANSMYEKFINAARAKGLRTETGVFQAVMEVELCNDGPVTLMIDSRE